MEKMAAKIVIVEDEIYVAEVIRDCLKSFGYEVTAMLETGEEAIKKVRESPPDLLLMDIVLEKNGEDGIEIADRIKNEFQIPVVFLTGYSDEEHIERAKRAEPLGYLIKPFNRNELKAVVELALSHAKIERERSLIYQQISRRLEIEKVISSISQQFVGKISIDTGIRKSMALLAKLRKAEYAYLCLFNEDGKSYKCIYDWQNCLDEKDMPDKPVKREFSLISPWIEKLKKGKIIHVKTVSNVSDDETEAEKRLLDKEIHSFLIIPVKTSSKVVGFIGFESRERSTDWTDEDVMLVRVASEIIIQVYERKKQEEELNTYKNHLEDLVSKRTMELSAINEELEKKIIEQALTEERLKTSLREKEVLLREIHHRVKNNLQVVSSLLNLQARALNEPAITDLVNESRNRVKIMALVHESLYESEELDRIDYGEYLRKLVNYLFRTYNRSDVTYELNATRVHLDINVAVPCGLIVNELVSNSLKHAFPDGRRGVVSISLDAGNNGTVTLRISDNGVGFPLNYDFKNPSSLGLQLVNDLALQIEAQMQVSFLGGAAYTLTFARQPQEMLIAQGGA
ncbi:MAG: histidine kinase dimerization/phosphoacceptor domain -containing protein [Vulcanimicrobiota bacterium]